MANRQNSSTNTTFAFSMVFLLAALCLVAVSFSTNHWLETYVDRDEIKDKVSGVTDVQMNQPVFYNRFRGLFLTCYPEEATFLDSSPYKDRLKDGRCLTETGYEIPTRNSDTVGYSDDYEIHIHLMRSQFAAMVLAMFFFVVCVVTSTVGCWNNNARMMRLTGILVFVGMFFAGAGMALFHGYNYLEVNELNEVPNTPAWIDAQTQSDLIYFHLNDKSTTQFGYSYILGWLGLAVSVVSAILYLITAYKINMAEERLLPSKGRAQRNRAYEYMDRPEPPADYYPKPRSFPPTYPVPEVGYFETTPYDFGGYYRY